MKRLSPWIVPILILLGVAGRRTGRADPPAGPARTVRGRRSGLAPRRSGELWTNIEVSAWRAWSGFAIGGGIGFALGMAQRPVVAVARS